MKHKNIDGSNLVFPQDERISFEEENHVYTIDGLLEFTSVSQVISKFFKEFDAEHWSLRKADGNEEEARRLRDEWTAKGEQASQAGTHLHKQIENFLSEGMEPTLTTHVFYQGPYCRIDEDISIDREWHHFESFRREHPIVPFRTEWCVFDADAKIAGTIDLLCRCDDGTFQIFDWKRSNRINPDDVNRWASGINGLEHITDTAYMHYCLQQNLYRYILERNYGLQISRMHLVVLHPDLPDYRLVEIPPMPNEVNTIIRNYPYL